MDSGGELKTASAETTAVKDFDPAAAVLHKIRDASAEIHQTKGKPICSPKDPDELKAKVAQFSSLSLQKNKKEKSIWGCSPKDSNVLKAKAAQFSSIPIHKKEEKSIRSFLSKDSDVLKAKAAQYSSLHIHRKKKKSMRGCSSNDSGELKAKEAQFSSLPIQENREEISTWGRSAPKDLDELKAKLAQFSTLRIQEKLVCLMAASFTIQDYDEQVRRFRKEEKDLLYYEGWTACLYKEELEMIGELDGKEAEKIYDEYDHYCFEIHLDRNRFDYMIQKYGELLPYEDVPNESFYKGPFADRKIDKSNEEAESYILGDKVRKKMLAEYESYQMKMEEVMCKWIDKYFIKSYEGACSETKFNQSDDQIMKRHA